MRDPYNPEYIASVEMPAELLRAVEAAVSAGFDAGHFSPEAIQSWSEGLGYGRQIILPLAYLFTCRESRLAGDERLAAAARAVGETLARDGKYEHRQLWALVEAKRLLREAGRAGELGMTDESAERSAAELAERLRGYRYLTHMTSSNMGTSTNHVAIMAAALLRWAQDAGRQEWAVLARETALKIVRDQHPDGWWAETTGGPTFLYNCLTMTAMGRVAVATGEDVFMQSALRAAGVHMRFSYPDGCFVETVDGRCRYHSVPMIWGGFVFSRTPAGRGYAALRMRTVRERSPVTTAIRYSGEHLALMCEDHALWKPGEVEPPPCLRRRYVETLSVGGMIRREGPWAVGFASEAHFPRPGANFTIDRQNILSVWHARTGLIVNGSGEDDRPETATFRINPMWSSQHRLQVAEEISMEPGRAKGAPATLTAEYRGGTCRMEVRFVSPTELDVRFTAGCAESLYPVHLTVPLELAYGGELRWRGGRKVLAPGERCDLAAEETGGSLGFGAWELEVSPLGEGAAPARLEWPYDPHNPYSPDKKSSPGMHVGLLRVELPPDGARLVIRIKEA